MEFEAVKQALGWLIQESLDVTTVVFATDSMAVCREARVAGYLMDGERLHLMSMINLPPLCMSQATLVSSAMTRLINLQQQQQNQQTRCHSFLKI